MATFAAPKIEQVRVGIVGVGRRGPSHVLNLLKLDHVEIKAVCDILPDRAQAAAALVTGPAAFLLGGLLDVMTYALGSLPRDRTRRSTIQSDESSDRRDRV